MVTKHPTDFTQAEFDKEQFARRFYFAKVCAKRGGKWSRVFEEKEGLTLREFKEKVDAYRKRKK